MEESKMVMEKARPHLEVLSKLAPQLNEASDLYQEELKEIEEALNKLKLGVTVWLELFIETSDIESEYDKDGDLVGNFYRAWSLGYGKDCGDRWRLLIREWKVDNDADDGTIENVIPLLEASRDLRIAAAERIPDLLKEVEEKVKRKLEVLSKVSDKP
jgi:hypothetical protein